MLELWGIQCTTLLSLLPGPFWPRVAAPMGQVELNCVLMLKWIVWNRTIYIKMDLALNNLQCLIYHKTKPIRSLLFVGIYSLRIHT